MIGKVHLKNIEIILEDNYEFKINKPELINYIRQLFKMYTYTYSPAKGPFGVEFLHQLAKKFNGKAIIDKKKSNRDENIVY